MYIYIYKKQNQGKNLFLNIEGDAKVYPTD